MVAMITSLISKFSPATALQASTNYYVSPTGNDSSAGTESAPFRTLAKALSIIKAGNTLYIRAGTYAAPATGWNFANSGTASQPITVTNYPGERVVLSADSSKSGNYIIKCLQVSPAVDNIRIIGTDVVSQAYNGVMSSKGIIMTGVRLGIAPAIAAYQCDNWEVAGIDFINVAYGIFQRKVNNGKTSADRWYVHDNRVYDYYRESGMQFNGNGNRIENNEISKVTNDYSSTYGCQLLNLLGNNNIVRGNKFARLSSTRCIGIFFEWDLADANLVENNSIIGVVNGISFFGGDNNIIRNNQLSGTDTAFVVRSWADGTTVYPCNFSDFMPVEGDTSNPDWQYMYPHDCRSKGNYFEGNTVSGFATFSTVNLSESSNVFVSATPLPNPVTPTATATLISNQPKTIYVSTLGNDANSGTETSPFLTISKAIGVASTGDTIYVRTGNYPAFTASKSGLKILAYPNETPLISGGGGVKLLGDYITLSGFEVINMTGNFSAAIVSYGDYNTIEENTVHDSTGTMSGVTVSGGSYNQVSRNTVYNNNFFGIGIYNSPGNNVISENTIYGHHAMAGDSDGIHCSKSSSNIIANNLVHDNADDGIDTWDCPSNIVSNNTVYHNGGTGDGNGIKVGYGGDNSVTGNISYNNLTCGFTSNGGGNYYENNTGYNNGTCGFEDDWRVNGNTQSSQFINNKAWGNPSGNFKTGKYTSVFEGNSEDLPQSQTPPSTFTSTPAPIFTATATPQTPIVTPTFTDIPPTLPSGTSVLTVVDRDVLLVGETGLVIVNLNGMPAEGVAGVEFTCTFPADLVSASNVQIGQIFGVDPVSAYNDSQAGSFIFAVSGSNGKVINTDGVALTFNITGIQPGSSAIDCKGIILRENAPLESIPSVPDPLIIAFQSTPTATPLPAPILAGQVIASKAVTISLFNPDATLAASGKTNADGSFNLSAPPGVFTVVASAEGHLSAQGTVNLREGSTTTLALIELPAGDIDSNGTIDQFDALTLGMNYNTLAPLPADLSNDGLTNLIDLKMLAENYRMAGALAWSQP